MGLPSRAPRMVAVAAAMAVVILAAAVALAQGSTLTKGGTALARSALLARADLGVGWSSQPGPTHVPALTCPGFAPRLSGPVEIGAAASPTFAQGSSGPFVSSVAYVYQAAGEATQVWGKVVTPKLLRCVAQSLVNGSSKGVKFTVSSKHLLALPPVASRRQGYRVIGTASQADQQIGVYLDVLVLQRGRMLTALSFSNFSVPAPRALELRLARTIARRLGG